MPQSYVKNTKSPTKQGDYLHYLAFYYIFGRIYEGCGTMFDEKIPVAESPQHTDARNTGIAGCSNVNVTVAHIYCIFATYP